MFVILLFFFQTECASFLFEITSKIVAQKLIRIVFNFGDLYNEFGAVEFCFGVLLFQVKLKFVLPRDVKSICFLFVGFDLKFFSSVHKRAVCFVFQIGFEFTLLE
jgi:hypothetical protein